MNAASLLRVIDYKKHFHINKHVYVKAVDGVSFEVRKGEIFALVGESGCGKSTMAKAVMGIFPANEGRIYFKEHLVSDKKAYKKGQKNIQRDLQVIFQDSAAALNPRMRVFDLIAEPLVVNKIHADKRALKNRIEELMNMVGLDWTYQSKYPGELSGGQRQRTAIARAIGLEPEMIVADEPVASLDVSVQAQIVALFQKLQREKGFSFLFIAHDLSLVRFISNRVGVMYAGKIVEAASTANLFADPRHPYTKSLLSAIPMPDPAYERHKKIIDFDRSMFKAEGSMVEVGPGHFVLT